MSQEFHHCPDGRGRTPFLDSTFSLFRPLVNCSYSNGKIRDPPQFSNQLPASPQPFMVPLTGCVTLERSLTSLSIKVLILKIKD
jgi:hypothetical protein